MVRRPLVCMKVFLTTLSAKKLELETDSNESIESFKRRLQDLVGIHLDSIRLMTPGRQLENHRTMGDYNIQEGAMIYMVMRMANRPTSRIEYSCSFAVIVAFEGRDYDVDIESKNVTVGNLKVKLGSLTQTAPDLQNLYFGPTLLTNAQKMAECAIGDKARLRLEKKAGPSYSEVVALQDIAGFWVASSDLTGLLGLSDFPPTPVDLVGRDTVEASWATALVLVWLEARRSDSKEEWKMIAKKGLKWLQKQGLQIKPLLAAASQLVPV